MLNITPMLKHQGMLVNKYVKNIFKNVYEV